MPEALFYIAGRYDYDQKYEKAKGVYEYIVKRCAQSSQSRTARLNVLRINITSLIDNGSDSDVIPSVNLLINNFRDHPDVYDAVFRIGNAYSIKGFPELNSDITKGKETLSKAINVYDKVLCALPFSNVYTPKAYYIEGVHYYHLGDYEKAIEYLEKVYNNWPNYERIWDVNLNLAQCYDQLVKSGRIEREATVDKINRYCKNVLVKCSDPFVIKTVRTIMKSYDLGE